LKGNRLQIRRVLELAVLTLMLVQPFLGCIPPVVEADPDTIYVPDDHPTIQYAIGNATAGDTIIVSSGTYRGPITVDRQLTIQGEDKETTFIDGMGASHVVTISAEGVEFGGFIIHNGSYGIYNSGEEDLRVFDCVVLNCANDGVYLYNSDSTIEDCTIYDNDDDGIFLVRTDNVTIDNCDIFDNGDDGIELRYSDNVRMVSCEIFNNTDYGVYLLTSHNDIVENCSINTNGDDGIFSEAASYNTRVLNCDFYGNTESGIYLASSSNNAQIINGDFQDNGGYGILLSYVTDTKIVNCYCYNNSFNGIHISTCENVLIKGCDIHNHTSYGIRLTNTHSVSVCNTTSYFNSRGLQVEHSTMLYVSKSTFSNNTMDGIQLVGVNGVIVNCNATDNADDGMDVMTCSEAGIRYCSIMDNGDYGIQQSESIINATECWWGDATGPYQPTLNPTGTGDRVDDIVAFEPWQSELHQPDELISDLRCRILRADESTVYYVPTGNIYDDSTFYAFYAYKDSPQIVTPPTQSSASNAFLDEDGSPLFDGDIVTFGGKFANRLVAYYEDAGLAKIGFENNGTHRIFRRISDGAHVCAVDSSTYNESEKDYFVFQVYGDGARYILSEWGIRAPGTYAGGTCFIDIIVPHVGSFTNSYLVFSWTDANGDGKPQSEEIAVEASGN